MKYQLKYLFLLLFLPLVSRSQPDTISNLTLQNFAQNLSGHEIYVAGTSNSSEPSTTFPDQFKANKGSLFHDELALSAKFYDFLNRFPASDREKLVQRFANYDNYFATVLKEAGLPEDLKYLAPALSAMNPVAADQDKRAGIWQLTHFQGVFNDLEINKLVDERFDTYKSTEAFTTQLKKNIDLFGSTEYAVLAYLSGNTSFRNALAVVGDRASVPSLITYLPDDVNESLAAFQAVTVFLKNVEVTEPAVSGNPDTVFVVQKMHFQQVSKVLDISLKDLQNLNPKYRYSIVPGDEEKSVLLLPAGKGADYLTMQDTIATAFDSTLFEVLAQKVEYPPAPNRQYVGEPVKDLEIEGKTKIKYTIKTGDVLGFIAEDFDVRVADLKYWNNIYNERKIRAGATLDIFVDDENADYYRKRYPEPTAKAATAESTAPTVYPIPESAKKIEHVVKSGESPYVIAKKYQGVTPEAILYWNGISDARKIQIGQKLTIYSIQ
ncbi:LysM peptidoglycan-binding domain-containing protein [Maribellus sediminis]|uniref:LysM peptidoglycan-binding domain-containing protein n=1 Tax=Maribellus sediminis TaxID=2696285 RepID=UPI001431C112|nr:LysM peptidoglycan-binding domain-containing protein [Maribellus sediminis]